MLFSEIRGRAKDEQGPAGTWDANRGKYGEKKRDVGLPVGVGLKPGRSARMLSLQQLKGEQVVTPTEATVTFGTDDFAKK